MTIHEEQIPNWIQEYVKKARKKNCFMLWGVGLLFMCVSLHKWALNSKCQTFTGSSILNVKMLLVICDNRFRVFGFWTVGWTKEAEEEKKNLKMWVLALGDCDDLIYENNLQTYSWWKYSLVHLSCSVLPAVILHCIYWLVPFSNWTSIRWNKVISCHLTVPGFWPNVFGWAVI